MTKPFAVPFAVLIAFGLAASTLHAEEAAKKPEQADAEKLEWKPLFDGKTLNGWKATQFGGQGEIEAEDGALVLNTGVDLTGVTWTGGPLPKRNYELRLEARRVDGSDFFCGITFPVGDDPCSLILGGWGGGVVGLSSINHFDASENETTQYVTFEKDRWYAIRLRVTDAKIEAWLDDEQIVDLETEGKKISIRPEVELSRPLGFATWQTTGELRNIRIASIPAATKSKSR